MNIHEFADLTALSVIAFGLIALALRIFIDKAK